MRIAVISPLYESVPPHYYGGTERVVSYLTEELVKLGHDVTLFASGDSVTNAKLVAVCPRALRLDQNSMDPLSHHVLMVEKVIQDSHHFDLIHFHVDLIHFPSIRRLRVPHLNTLHGRLDIPDLVPLFREFSELAFSSISYAQRKPLEWLNWAGNVYHGLPIELYNFYPQPREYFAFLGRISPEKGVDSAIEIAERSGIPLKIAAKVDKQDQEYYETRIKPMMDHPLVEFLGEVADAEKKDLLCNAKALLFPVDWPEPFGLVMIEAMACGTPVIAFNRGSVSEVITDGETGFVVSDIEAAVKAAAKIPMLSRKKCREVFESRFSSTRMALDYTEVYHKLLDRKVESAA